ncbi:MAG: tripartite tricarboxylate transporter substrate binding protein [Proteobacteria bacterium]|nr:tripartite tricarboxylate transporter substrate binding protein [Burkholderiales bacterium]
MESGKLALLIAAALFTTSDPRAQTYPVKPVRVIVPITVGSGNDIVVRLLSQKLADAWGQPVLVENRPGGGTTAGTAAVARAPSDGYTLLGSGSGFATSQAISTKLPYDPLKDLIAIAPLARLVQVLVTAPSAGYASVAELVAAAKARPGQITYASPGTGTGVHFTMEKFRIESGIDAMHVPYKGGPEAMNDVIAGRVTFSIPSIGTAMPFIRGGQLRALGVTSLTRAPDLPGVSTLDEAGVRGFEDVIWFGMWSPAGTPPAIVEKIAGDIARALALPETRDQLAKLSSEPMSMSPADFSRFVRREIESASRVAKAANITAQ